MKREIVWSAVNFGAAMYCCFVTLINNLEYNFFFIPLTYFLLFAICQKSRRLFGKTPGVTVVMIVMFMRYIVLPVVLCNTNQLSMYANNYKHMGSAIVILLYEMVAIFLTLELTASKAWNFYILPKENGRRNIIVKPSFLIICIILLVLVGIYITNQDLLNAAALFTTGVTNTEESMEDISSAVKILWQCMTAWIFVYAVNRQKDKYEENGEKKVYVFVSIFFALVFVFVTYIGQARISRWYPLVSAVSAIFLLMSLFPEEKKRIVSYITIPVIALLLIASTLKMGIYSSGSSIDLGEQISDLITPTSVDVYFAGPVSVNNSIGLLLEGDVSILNLPYDIFNNMPVVNHFIESGHSTVYLYNWYLGRIFNGSGDQIIPLVGQSTIFFGYIFAPLLSVLSICLLRWADKKYMQSSNYMKYVWGFSAVWFGLESILNMTINLSWIYIRIIPLFIIFGAIEYISKKQTVEYLEIEDEK